MRGLGRSLQGAHYLKQEHQDEEQRKRAHEDGDGCNRLDRRAPGGPIPDSVDGQRGQACTTEQCSAYGYKEVVDEE